MNENISRSIGNKLLYSSTAFLLPLSPVDITTYNNMQSISVDSEKLTSYYKNISDLREKLEQHSERLARLETKLEETKDIKDWLKDLDAKLERLATKDSIDKLTEKINELEKEMEGIKKDINWIKKIGGGIGGIIAFIIVIVKAVQYFSKS